MPWPLAHSLLLNLFFFLLDWFHLNESPEALTRDFNFSSQAVLDFWLLTLIIGLIIGLNYQWFTGNLRETSFVHTVFSEFICFLLISVLYFPLHCFNYVEGCLLSVLFFIWGILQGSINVCLLWTLLWLQWYLLFNSIII